MLDLKTKFKLQVFCCLLWKQIMYVCLEGIEGVGKTTQTTALHCALNKQLGSDRVTVTSEPGNLNSLLTMQLRNLMLDARWDKEMTIIAREYISQAARCVNLQTIVSPALKKHQIVIQDRGLLSGLAYGLQCGNEIELLQTLANHTYMDLKKLKPQIYDLIIVLTTSQPEMCLKRARKYKVEFKEGDNIENRGSEFMSRVADTMLNAKHNKLVSCPVIYIDVDNKDIEQLHKEIHSVVMDVFKVTYIP